MKKILCLFCITIATIFGLLAAFLAFIFYTESGRNFLISEIESYARKSDIVLKISHSKNNFEKKFFDFSEIFLGLKNAEILIKNFSEGDKKINVSDIYVTQFEKSPKTTENKLDEKNLQKYDEIEKNIDTNLKSEQTKNNSNKNQSSEKQITDKKTDDFFDLSQNIFDTQKNISDNSKYVEFFRYIIKEINIKNIKINTPNKHYEISDLSFKNEEHHDTFFANFHDYGTIDLKMTRSILFYSKMLLKIDGKIFNADLTLSEFNSFNPKYILKATYFKTKLPTQINMEGNIKNEIIKISKGSINFDKKDYKVSGEINLKNKKINLYSDFYSNDFLTSKNIITDMLKNIKAKCELQTDFDFKGTANIKLEREKKDIGKVDIDFDKKDLHLKGDIPFINLYNFKFKKFEADVKNYPQIISDIPAADKDLFLKIYGENFEGSAEGEFLKKFLLKKLQLKSGDGELFLSTPSFVDLNSDFSITLEYKNLELFRPLIKMSGSGKVTLKHKNGIFSIDAGIPKIEHKNIKIIDSILKIHDRLKMHFSAQEIFIDNFKLKEILAQANQDKFNISAIMSEKKNFSIQGDIILDDFQIKLSNTKISFAKHDFFLSNLIINFEKENVFLKLNIGTFENNQKGNEVSVNYNANACDLKIQNLDLRKVNKIFEKTFPLNTLNANFNLKARNDFLIGNGNINLQGFFSASNTLESKIQFLNNQLKLDTIIHSKSDNMLLNFSLPFGLTKKYEIIKFSSGNFSGFIKGNLFLENFLALADKIEIRGKITSDLIFSGSVFSPKIDGKISLSNGLFAINDLVLSNAQVNLKGNQNKLEVLSASFMDSSNHKLNVRGFSEIFFDEFIPKLATHFDLDFDRFRLFDSDDLVVILSGKGKILGIIPNIIIKGEMNVHRCEVNNIERSSEEHLPIHYKGKSVKDLEERKDEKSVFDYDVIMHGEDVILSNPMCEIHMAGDFVLNTYNEFATLIGKAKFKKGKLDFFGKRMNFTKGEAEFFKEYPFNPKADLLCERNFGDLSVRIRVLNDPKKGGEVVLQSTPSYSTDIILSKVLFGKELQQLSVEEAAELAHAVSSFNNKGYLFSILNTFKKIGIFDTISFSETPQEKKLYTDKSSSNGQKNTNIKAGKYIGDKVFISVNKNDEGASFDIDYSITPSISIKANTNGEAGVSFKYRY